MSGRSPSRQDHEFIYKHAVATIYLRAGDCFRLRTMLCADKGGFAICPASHVCWIARVDCRRCLVGRVRLARRTLNASTRNVARDSCTRLHRYDTDFWRDVFEPGTDGGRNCVSVGEYAGIVHCWARADFF